jgi:threonine aldolase
MEYPMDCIDLRSDTVTWPTLEMREAMAAALVGDDVWGDDPTVLRLEAMSAERLGKEAALFVTSGTQGNLIALLTHCGRMDEYICGNLNHTFWDEVGGAAALGGIHTHTIPVQEDGTLAHEDIEAAIRDPGDVHFPYSRLIALENTHGMRG